MAFRWDVETSRYTPRLEALSRHIDEAESILSSLGVTAPMSPDRTVRAILMTQLILFQVGAVRIARELTDATEVLFRDGMVTPTCLQIRLLLELWGAIAFSSSLGERVRDATDLVDSEKLSGLVTPINRLIGGSRTPVRLPRGGQTDSRSFNVMKFIQHLEKRHPGIEAEYGFLCEACHPSFVQQSYLWMAGRMGDNWANPIFRKHAHSLLERLVLVAEEAADGIADSSKKLVVDASPFVMDYS